MTNDSDGSTGSLDSSINRALLDAFAAAHSEHAAAQLALRDALCVFIARHRSLGHSLDDSLAAVRASAILARRNRPNDTRDVSLADQQLELMIHWCVANRHA